MLFLEVCAGSRGQVLTTGFPVCKEKDLAKNADVNVAFDLTTQLADLTEWEETWAVTLILYI